MARRFPHLIGACFLALGLFLSSAFALENIVIGYPTTSSQYAPLWFARDVGLYEMHGLDANLVLIQGGGVVIQAMLAGQVHAAQIGIAETVVAILRRGDIRMLGVTAKVFPYTLIVSKGVKSAKDLVGGKIAVNRLGDVSAIGSQIALRKRWG